MHAVDLVFVNYHSEDDLANALNELMLAESHGLRLSVRVVDCSRMGAGAAARLTASPVPVEVLDAGRNIGFAAAANLGAAAGTAPILGFVNPDVALDLSRFAELVCAGTSHGVVAWSGILRNTDGTVQRNAAPAPSLRQLGAEYLIGMDTRLASSTTQRAVAVLTGALLLVDRMAFEAAGGFDPSFPLYVEDVELSCRLAKRGRLVQYPIEVGTHIGGRSARHAPCETWLLLHASRVALFARQGRLNWAVARTVVLAGAFARALVAHPTTLPWLPQLVRATARGFPLARLLPPSGGGRVA